MCIRDRGAAAADGDAAGQSLAALWAAWEEEGRGFWGEMEALVAVLDGLVGYNRSG